MEKFCDWADSKLTLWSQQGGRKPSGMGLSPESVGGFSYLHHMCDSQKERWAFDWQCSCLPQWILLLRNGSLCLPPPPLMATQCYQWSGIPGDNHKTAIIWRPVKNGGTHSWILFIFSANVTEHYFATLWSLMTYPNRSRFQRQR